MVVLYGTIRTQAKIARAAQQIYGDVSYNCPKILLIRRKKKNNRQMQSGIQSVKHTFGFTTISCSGAETLDGVLCTGKASAIFGVMGVLSSLGPTEDGEPWANDCE